MISFSNSLRDGRASIFFLLACLAVAALIVCAATHFMRARRRKRLTTGIPFEIMGFVYDPERDIFKSSIDAWQKQFGYCKLYDWYAPRTGMMIDSEPVIFSYDGRQWLLEFWKGQYGLTCGAEMGVYVTQEDSPCISDEHFDAVDSGDFLHMSFALYKDGKPYFDNIGLHWWLTGFRLGDYAKPGDLGMKARVSLKDEAMLGAFVGALVKLGYTRDRLNIAGNTVEFFFDKPYAVQPCTRTMWYPRLLQHIIKFLCGRLGRLLGGAGSVVEQLALLSVYHPIYYRLATRFAAGGNLRKGARKEARLRRKEGERA